MIVEVDNEIGLVTDVQDFAVQDGPGLRVVVFLKGCPLRCTWCQNPEGLSRDPEIAFHASDCAGCLRCKEICPIPGAIVEDKERRIDRSKCIKCMQCVNVCVGKALRKVGEQMSVDQLVQRVVRYKPFFDGSDRGGITLSGGEPTFQPEFTLKTLKACRDIGIHTAIETCGYTSYEILSEIARASDLILYDIKHMDDASHIKGTGKSNSLILTNLKKLSQETNAEIAIRIPLITGFNDSIENVRKTAEFVRSLNNIRRLDLLSFNELASAKYKAMDLQWDHRDTRSQSNEHLDELRKTVEACALESTIGGLW